MTPLLLPYVFNILVLVPIGLLTLFGGERDGRLAYQGKFPESEGFRTIVGSLWTAILVGSVIGLLHPVLLSNAPRAYLLVCSSKRRLRESFKARSKCHATC